jgi:flagellar motor switch/type III secretory pathway protein FliN
LTIIKKKTDGITAINSRVNPDIAESLMDVRVKITVEVGQTRMPIAFGEAVEVNGKLAVRITEVIGKKALTPNSEFKRSA